MMPNAKPRTHIHNSMTCYIDETTCLIEYRRNLIEDRHGLFRSALLPLCCKRNQTTNKFQETAAWRLGSIKWCRENKIQRRVFGGVTDGAGNEEARVGVLEERWGGAVVEARDAYYCWVLLPWRHRLLRLFISSFSRTHFPPFFSLFLLPRATEKLPSLSQPSPWGGEQGWGGTRGAILGLARSPGQGPGLPVPTYRIR